MSQSNWEKVFALQLRILNLPLFYTEYRFDNTRRWRFDFAWPEKLVSVEIEGGIYRGGRHTSIKGFTADCEKYNAAALQGWQVLRFTPQHVKSGYALKTIETALEMP